MDEWRGGEQRKQQRTPTAEEIRSADELLRSSREARIGRRGWEPIPMVDCNYDEWQLAPFGSDKLRKLHARASMGFSGGASSGGASSSGGGSAAADIEDAELTSPSSDDDDDAAGDEAREEEEDGDAELAAPAAEAGAVQADGSADEDEVKTEIGSDVAEDELMLLQAEAVEAGGEETEVGEADSQSNAASSDSDGESSIPLRQLAGIIRCNQVLKAVQSRVLEAMVEGAVATAAQLVRGREDSDEDDLPLDQRPVLVRMRAEASTHDGSAPEGMEVEDAAADADEAPALASAGGWMQRTAAQQEMQRRLRAALEVMQWPSTAAEAERMAHDEGLQLRESSRADSGFAGVDRVYGDQWRAQITLPKAGSEHLMLLMIKEGASLAVARASKLLEQWM